MSWMSVCLLFIIISVLTCQFFSVKWTKSSRQTSILTKNSTDSINRLVQIVFLLICIYKSAAILNFGLFDFFVLARTGDVSIGALLYFVLILFPLNLAYEISERRFNWFNIISLAFLIFLNLVTGFRFLLIYALAVILIFNWRLVLNISTTKIALGFLFIMIFLGAYEILRYEIEASGLGYKNPPILDRLNRTAPINMLQLIETKTLSLAPNNVIRLFAEPMALFLGSVGLNFERLIDVNFNLINVSEPLFSDYLYWKGTPLYDATGFSISIISYSYLFMQEVGVFIFAIFYGFFVAIGCKLLKSDIYENKILGSIFLTGCFLCNESVTEATKLLVYNFIFILFIAIIFLIRRTIMNTQSN